MIVNHTDFSILKPNQELYVVRYSQSPYPDYTIVKFKFYNVGTGIIEVIKTSPKGKNSTMTFSDQKATFRLFYDKLEMAKALYECFLKRNLLDVIPYEYKELIHLSQDNRPEIWV